MVRRTGLWKTILLTAFAAVLINGAPASALVTIDAGTTVTFAWTAASGNVAGYYVIVERPDGASFVYSTVYGRTSETVVAEPNETISVRVMAFDAAGAYGEPSSPSEPVYFAAIPGNETPPPVAPGEAQDFDGDGVSDVIVQSGNRGYLEITSMRTGESTLITKCRERANGTTKCRTVRMNGRSWMIVGNGDYDGDGVTDILFRRHRKGVQRTGTVSVFFMDGDRVRDIVKLETEKCVQRQDGSSRCRFARTRVRKDWQIVGSSSLRATSMAMECLTSSGEISKTEWSTSGGSPGIRRSARWRVERVHGAQLEPAISTVTSAMMCCCERSIRISSLCASPRLVCAT
jgi:hypothetical protein